MKKSAIDQQKAKNKQGTCTGLVLYPLDNQPQAGNLLRSIYHFLLQKLANVSRLP